MAVVIAVALTAAVVAALAWWWIRLRYLRPLGDLAAAEVDALRPDLALAKVARDHRASVEQATHLQARVARLESALDQLGTGVVVGDASGARLVTNDVATSMASGHAAALVDAAVSDLLDGACAGHAGHQELDLFGPPRHLLLLTSMPVEVDGAIAGGVVVIDDVTEAQRVESMRRDFVANLSHELRTPISAIGLVAETVAGETDPDTVKRLTGHLLDEADRLMVTVDDLLELSRIEHGDSLEMSEFDLHDVLSEAMKAIEVKAAAGEIRLDVVAPDEPIRVTADRRQLVIAVTNLLDNGVKYTPEGGSVVVRVHRAPDAVEIAVQDTGIGIPDRSVGRVFERFYRGDPSRHSDTGGSGLGLAIVRHVMLAHGGDVSVESFDGDGSTFTMRLPSMLEVAPTIGLDQAREGSDRSIEEASR